jgi:uncharacterized glyoxalase superfamily protein PhnB
MVGAFEHVALNVRDQKAVEDWYVANLGFKVLGSNSAGAGFLADSSGRMVFELFSRTDVPYFNAESTHSLSMHIAYECDDVEAETEKLLQAGATEDIPLAVAPEGDKLVMLRDPFGITIQLINRANPFPT